MKEIFHKRQCLTPEEIKGYINSSLPPESLHSIEQHLLDCALCDAAIEGWSKIDQPDQALAQLENTKPEEIKPPSLTTSGKNKPVKQRIILITAAASIALILAFTFLFNRLQSTHTAVFEQYYEYVAMPSPAVRNSAETEIRDLTKTAYDAYRQKNFSASAAAFDQILQIDRKNPVALYFGGLSQLETGNPEVAINYFDNLASQTGAQYAEDANWHLALALLRNNDIERAREVLHDIVNRRGYFSEKAGRLLGKLERL